MAPAEPEGRLRPTLSPVAGTSYRIPGPGEAPHVEPGGVVETGRELCFIQTTEPAREAVPGLSAGYSGEVVEVLAEEAGSVQAGQAVFRLRTDGA